MSLTTLARDGLPAPDPSTLVAAAPEVAPGTLWYDSTYVGYVVVTALAEILPDQWTVGFDIAWPENAADYCGPLPATVWLRDWHRFMIPPAPQPILCSWCEAPATDSAGAEPACASHAASFNRHPATADDTPPWGSERPNLTLINGGATHRKWEDVKPSPALLAWADLDSGGAVSDIVASPVLDSIGDTL